MSGLITLTWVGQSILLFVVSALCFFAPQRFLPFLWGGRFPPSGDLALSFIVAEVRLCVPLMLGFSLFSSAASMRDDERVRRRMSGGFALTLGLCAYLFVRHDERLLGLAARDEHHGLPWSITTALFLLAVILQAAYALSPLAEPVAPRLSGTADTKPPHLWGLWMIQGLGFIVAGAALWFATAPEVASITFLPPVRAALAPWRAAEFSVDLHGVTCIGIGLLSLHATTVEREWHWQLYSGVFALVAGASLAARLFVWDAGLQTALAALPMLPALGMLLGNAYFWRRRRDPIAEEIGHGPDGWTLLDVPTGPWLAIQSFFAHRRATHPMGVAVRGTFHIVDAPEFPPNAFFTAGLRLPLQARFAALSSRDDASNDLRGASLRLSAHVDVPSPFDVLMNAGSFSGPEDMVKFALGVFTRFLPQSFFYGAVRNDRQVREGLIAGRRRAPECVTLMHYYTQIVRFWIDDEDVRWLVRYRLLDPTRPESGLATPDEASRIWVRERKKGEHRPSNYLRDALKARLTEGNTITMRFQAQFHRPEPGDTLDWYNAGVDWPDDHEHRWREVATVTLEEPLSDEEAERMSFNAANHPPSLGIPTAPSMTDYRSLGDSERRVIRRLARQRQWMYRVFGYPRFGNTLPDEKGR